MRQLKTKPINMKRLLTFSLFLLSLSICIGQVDNKISIGTIDSVQSKILNENRHLLVSLPATYDSKQKYPVVYLLDGESFFHFYTGIVNHLSGSYVIPDMIVIGIVNTNRNLDFTTTTDTTSNNGPNGGGENFTSFLEKELIPYVESHYSSAPYRILVGHSIGGLLVVNTLLKHPALFNSYVALDPALWWDKMKLNNQSSKILIENNFKDKNLFLAMANSMPMGMTDTTQVKVDTTNSTVGMRSVFQFRDNLLKSTNNDLRWDFKYYENEFHGSVPLISSYDALKFIFDFYKRPSFQKMTDSTAIILENHYKKVSVKMGYTILPPVSDISGLAWRSRVLEKNYDRAFVFLQMYIRLYPNDPNAYIEMGQWYDEKGDKTKAQEFYEKSSQVGH